MLGESFSECNTNQLERKLLEMTKFTKVLKNSFGASTAGFQNISTTIKRALKLILEIIKAPEAKRLKNKSKAGN